MNRPRVLDLFCCAGGAGYGYFLAGFEVVGVDIAPQKNYPFEFHQADALTFPLDGFDLIHASPPCQAHSVGTSMKGTRANHDDLIPAVRARLQASGVPYIIENVVGAPLIGPVRLCGTMFPPLRVFRHRLFECSFLAMAPPHGRHPKTARVVGSPLAGNRAAPLGKRLVEQRKQYGPEDWVSVAGHSFIAEHGRQAMGIDWMTRDELAQAIPPAYTRFLGEQAIRLITTQGAAA